MLRYRSIDVEKDRDALLEFHCRANYGSATPWAKRMPYDDYRTKWLTTSQPQGFLQSLAKSMEDPHTIAQICLDDNTVVGYLLDGVPPDH